MIPKTHIPSLLEASPEDLSELMATVRQVAAEVMGEHGACRVITNLGNYQDSKHLHWHVVSGGPMKD